MLSIGLSQDDVGANYLQETFILLAEPRHTSARELLSFWQNRPADGILLGRDIPSRRIARLLSHITVWEPVDGGRDYRMRYMGETLRARHNGYGVGKMMSELVSPELFAYQLDAFPRLAAGDEMEILDVAQSYSGCNYLHYEVLVFPVTAPEETERWLVAGTFYY